MNNIIFEEREHKRYYISTYQNLEILVPKSLKEQNKIAETILYMDNLIESYIKKISVLEQHRQGLMQQLFPKI